MATTTFSANNIPTHWTLIVDGANYQRFGIQLCSSYACDLSISTSLPSGETMNFIYLSRPGSLEFSEELSSGDKVYARSRDGESGLAILHGYRVTR